MCIAVSSVWLTEDGGRGGGGCQDLDVGLTFRIEFPICE